MPIQNLHTLTETQFNGLLRRTIGQLEGDEPLAYLDSNGIPTIGVGFNLSDINVRNNVFLAMGIVTVAAQSAIIAEINAATNNATIRALPDLPARNTELQRRLSVAYGQAFQMTDGQIQSIYDDEVRGRISAVRASSGLGFSLELVALVSLQFNGVYGPNLRAALAKTDPAEARADKHRQRSLRNSPIDGQLRAKAAGAARRMASLQVSSCSNIKGALLLAANVFHSARAA